MSNQNTKDEKNIIGLNNYIIANTAKQIGKSNLQHNY